MKNKQLFQNKIAVRKSRMHGFGVFALKKIRKGEIIEECYALISRRGGDKKLEDYYFDADGHYAILFGFGCIYNHLDDPNADYVINRRTNIATFKAEKTIQKGEEIYVSYGDEWFKTRDLKAKQKPRVLKKRRKKA
jgi:SET domain-containing protein